MFSYLYQTVSSGLMSLLICSFVSALISVTLPSWRLFRVDKITMLKPTRENFTQAQPGYNFNGDKSMTQVIVIAKFDNTTT